MIEACCRMIVRKLASTAFVGAGLHGSHSTDNSRDKSEKDRETKREIEREGERERWKKKKRKSCRNGLE